VRTTRTTQGLSLAAGVVGLLGVWWLASSHGSIPQVAGGQSPSGSDSDRQSSTAPAGFRRTEISVEDELGVTPAAATRAPGQPVVPGEPSLPRILEVGALLRSPTEQILERLDLPDLVRTFLASPEGSRIAEEEVRAARERLDDLFSAHSRVSITAAKKLMAEGGGRRTAPAEAERESYSLLQANNDRVWLSKTEAPELFAIKGAMRRMPRELADALARRATEAMPPFVPPQAITVPDPHRR
jgi:hypothetical protein